MIRTLRKTGNSYGLIIERPVMELLGITPDSELDVTVEGGALIIRPVKQTSAPKVDRGATQGSERGPP